MKILVTGGMGFVGSHLVDALVRLGHRVVVFDNLEKQVHGGRKPDYLNPDARYRIGDVRNYAAFKKVLVDCDIVFHEAAMVGVGQSMYKIAHYIYSNDLGTANLLDILVNHKNKVKKIVLASSMSIYGEGMYRCKNCGEVTPGLRADSQLKKRKWEMRCPNCNLKVIPLPTPEHKILIPTSIYAMSKRHQEEVCLLVGKTYNIPTVALRYFNIYGPRQSLSNPYTGVCAIFASTIKNNHRPIVYEDGLQSRDFINVKDIVRANLLVMKDNRVDYQYFNVGTGQPKTILDIADILIKLHGKDLKPKIVNAYRKGDIRHCFADTSKLSKLGFKLSVDFEEGIKELAEWQKYSSAKDKTALAQHELYKKGLVIK